MFEKYVNDLLRSKETILTVGDLVAVLTELPQDFEILGSFDDKPIYELFVDPVEKVVWL